MSSSEPQDGISMQWGVRIPLRDGVNLSATLYLPVSHSKPSPVLFTVTPYVAQTWHEYATFFASRGYPFLTIDVRGRGNSEGTFKANGNEARDGYDVVEWIARQPYCSGKVAMWGGSYGGYAQWATAREGPPHLAAIAPVAPPFRGVDTPMRNNIFAPYRIQWLTLLAGRTSQDRIFADQAFWNRQFRRGFESGAPFRQLDRLLGNPSPVFQEWLEHPYQDAYWDSYNPTAAQYASISTPVLTITGTYDGNQLGAFMHYREHLKNATSEARATHFLVIGPWDHAGTRAPKSGFCGLQVGPASLLDMNELHRQWYAWAMEGGARPEFLRKRVACYVMGAERWRYADSLDELTGHHCSYHLASSANPDDVLRGGSLQPARSCGGPDHYTYDPRDVCLAALESTVDPESRVDQRMIYARRGKQLVYYTEPFEADVEVTGFFRLTLWLAIDCPDTDFSALVSDVALDGGATLMTTDMLRARYRESLREPKLIGTTEPLCYRFERFTFVSRVVRKGHRLRLVVGPINSIYSEKNYNSGGTVADESMRDARVVTVRLFHDSRHPSALHVPLGRLEN